MVSKKRGWWLLWLIVSGPSIFAQIRVPRLIGDGMVLQRGMPLRIWGFGPPGGNVTVKFAGESATGVTDDNGKWVVELSPKKAGGPYTMDIDGINHIWLTNIMVGEVWFCAGQFNMQLPMEKLREQYADVIGHAGDLPVREFRINEHYDYQGPRSNVSGGHWQVANPAAVLSFPALGYLFARQICEQYHCAVGLIDASVGDAPAEAWLSPETLQRFPEYASAAARYADSTFSDGTGPADRMAPGGLFNGMVAPAELYTVRGVLWWQGEANVGRAGEYSRLFPALIDDWRQHWNEGAMPFLYVQLEAHGPAPALPSANAESQWAELREAQRKALVLPATGMSVSDDLDETGDLQPKDFQEIARRLALSAEGIAIGRKDVIFSGPLYKSMKVHGDRVHILFNEVGNGLVAAGGGELRGFAVAGADNKFFPAKAETDGKKVIVWSDEVAHPEAIRYAWADNPYGANLFNRDILFQNGLPAPAFAGKAKIKKH
ncbi:MAG TPA: sialate O-acetylesterase [Puia sp.]|nr:sialate O-acetylesterase [Puia sp.]